MAQCPVCQHELTDDFGLIDCPSCKTPLIVQMDGSVQSASAEAGATQSEAPEQAPLDFSDSAEGPPSVATSFESLALDEINADSGIHNIGDEPPPPIEESVEAPLESEASQPALSEESTVDVFFGDPAPDVPPSPVAPISDMSSLANDTETAAQGSLRYTILIAGIDTADIRGEFKDLISDRRFLWDVDGILKSIRSGNLRIENVTAVKAMLLVQRLRELPLQVRWEQHVVHQV